MNRLVSDPKLMKDPKDQPGAVAGFAAAQKRIGKDGYSGLKSPRQDPDTKRRKPGHPLLLRRETGRLLYSRGES
jgi:hypothetical protein